MAMEGAGLGLAVLEEGRSLVVSLRERWTSYRDGPRRFQTVDDNVPTLLVVLDDIVGIASTHPDALPSGTSGIFHATVSEVRDMLARSSEMLNAYCAKAFGNSSSGGAVHMAKKCLRVVRAKSLTAAMKDIEKETSEVKNTLQHLLTQLVVVLKTDEAEDNVQNAIIVQVATPEVFHPAFNAPVLSGCVILDFDVKDTEGNFASPEGNLREMVFQSTSASSNLVKIARGAPFLVHAVSGMAGVGKTTALIGLGHDEKVQEHFKDGVLFMSLGAEELEEIMRATGAINSANAVNSAPSLADAISKASVWSQGRRILFIVDDIWPSSNHSEGFLPDLQLILKGSPESRLAISTRSRAIAAKVGSHVDFGAQEPQRPVSVAMFLSYASPNFHRDDDERGATRNILDLCAGLPIALDITEQAVALRVTLGLGFLLACRTYLDELSQEMYPGAPILFTTIRLSLRALEENYEGVQTILRYSFSEMYRSLCVLINQQFASIPVLGRMWKLGDLAALQVCLEVCLWMMGVSKTGWYCTTFTWSIAVMWQRK